MGSFAIDIGTTNSAVARWNAKDERPEMVALPAVQRAAAGEDPLEVPAVVPSAVHAIEDPGFWARLGQSRLLTRHTFLGRLAHIGQAALDLNQGMPRPSFAPTFKPFLGPSPTRTLARLGSEPLTARRVAQLFTRELFAEIKRVTGERVRDLVLTVPVESYEGYRAELLELGRRLGVKKLRFLDEPVAAAAGYGITSGGDRTVLVVDFGGGTLDLALVRTGGRLGLDGQCEVVAKEGRGLGGDHVDEWILEAVCERLALPFKRRGLDESWGIWLHLMRGEARRVKEALFVRPQENFNLIPPEELRRFEAQLKGEAEAVELTREQLVELLRQRGMYRTLEGCIDDMTASAAAAGLPLSQVDDVLMVGGSTLLPGVYPLFEQRFGRARVRAWQPFEAVAYGAALFAAGQQVQNDFIVHDYAFVTYDAATNEPQYTVIVPRGTRFPTAPDLWKRRLVPTCPLGDPEPFYKLVVCELGKPQGEERRFTWDERGDLHKVGGKGNGAGAPLVVPLNEANPTLGELRPPHPPGDRRPRLEISFGVNAERWLVATVVDLWSKRTLKTEDPVVRLL